MIDHLLHFATIKSARQALGAIERDGRWHFPASVTLNVGGPNNESVRVITQEAVWDHSTMPPTLTTPEILAPGWWCIVSKPELDETLRDLPRKAARVIADRNAERDGATDFRLHTASDLAADYFDVVRVEPIPAGAGHLFGKGERTHVRIAREERQEREARTEFDKREKREREQQTLLEGSRTNLLINDGGMTTADWHSVKPV